MPVAGIETSVNERRHRLPLGILIIIPVVLGFALYAFTGQRQVGPAPTPALEATAEEAATVIPTPAPPLSPPPFSPPASATDEPPARFQGTPPEPGPAAKPVLMQHGAFSDGSWVRVNAGAGDCLNARSAPSTTAPYTGVEECLPDGTEGVLVGPAIDGDGHWWWRLAGSGYVAEDFLTYIGVFDERGPRARGAAMPAGARGIIAFSRDDEIRTMDLDTGDERAIVQLPTRGDKADSYIQPATDLSWSPDGTMLSYNLGEEAADAEGQRPVNLHIIRRDGSPVTVVHGVAGRGWSPDSARMGIVIGASEQQMGGGWNGVPGLLDIATSEIVRLDADKFYQQDPPSFGPDGSLVLMSRGENETAADGTLRFVQSFVVVDLAGNVVARLTPPNDAGYYSPIWSPAGNQIAFFESAGSEDSYVVWDIAAGGIFARSSLPDRNPNAGGGCGASDMYRASYSDDGGTLYYAAMYRESGMNGVWAWNIRSGETRLVPASQVIAPAAGPGALAVFASDGYVFLADTTTGARTILTRGQQPVWSP